MKTARERQQEKRELRLQEMKDEIASGKLVVRQMTAEERARFPSRPATDRKRPSRYKPS